MGSLDLLQKTTQFLLAYNDGDDVAVLSIHNDAGEHRFQFHGYGHIGQRGYGDESYHGRMAADSSHVVMANQSFQDAWIFNVTGNSSHDKLDRRAESPEELEDDYDGDDRNTPDFVRNHVGAREIAVGKVMFPEFGGNPPETENNRNMNVIAVPSDENFGDGGPIALALNGRWLVGGFSNGSLVRAPLLPQGEFHSTAEANCHSCWSSLPSDEWHAPVLGDPEDA